MNRKMVWIFCLCLSFMAVLASIGLIFQGETVIGILLLILNTCGVIYDIFQINIIRYKVKLGRVSK